MLTRQPAASAVVWCHCELHNGSKKTKSEHTFILCCGIRLLQQTPLRRGPPRPRRRRRSSTPRPYQVLLPGQTQMAVAGAEGQNDGPNQIRFILGLHSVVSPHRREAGHRGEVHLHPHGLCLGLELLGEGRTAHLRHPRVVLLPGGVRDLAAGGVPLQHQHRPPSPGGVQSVGKSCGAATNNQHIVHEHPSIETGMPQRCRGICIQDNSLSRRWRGGCPE